MDCVSSRWVRLLAIAGTAFHPRTLGVDGLLSICEGCFLHTLTAAAGW